MDYKYWSIINTIVRPTLWVFFALSGFLLLERPIKSVTNFYLTRISKAVIGLVVYSIIYQTAWDTNNFNSIRDSIKLISYKQMLSGTVPWAEHFWFVYSILALYILTPFISDCFKSMTNKRFIYFVSIVLGFMVMLPILKNFFNVSININIMIGNEAFFYYILGYTILRLELFRFKKIIYISGILTLILTYQFNFNSKLALNLYTTSINMVILSIFYFVLFYNCSFISKFSGTLARVITHVSKSTYSIFLIHIYVMRHLPNYSYFPEETYRYQLIINIILIFVVSFIFTQIIDFIVTNPINKLVTKLIKHCDPRKFKTLPVSK